MGVLGAGKEKSVSYDFQSVKASAVKGDAGAQCTLGWMYDAGKGVAENDSEAVKWFWMAAQQGHAVGQRNLGAMYMKGGSVPVNYVTAYAWFGIAASNGNEGAGGVEGNGHQENDARPNRGGGEVLQGYHCKVSEGGSEKTGSSSSEASGS